jgi:hypothetical protein
MLDHFEQAMAESHLSLSPFGDITFGLTLTPWRAFNSIAPIPRFSKKETDFDAQPRRK